MPKKPLTQKDIETLRSFYARLGSSNSDETRRMLQHILRKLQHFGLTWKDLLQKTTVKRPPEPRFTSPDLIRLRELHDLLGTADDQTRETIVKRINEILERARADWIDLLDIIASAPTGSTGSSPLQPPTPAEVPNPLDLLTAIIPDFWDVSSDEMIMYCCWMGACYFYKQFTKFPRLAILSPVRGCGKTTGLNLLKALCPNPHKTDNITPAGIYHLIKQARDTTLLMDEMDNADLPRAGPLRSVLNSGHEDGGTVDRVVPGEGTYSYSTYCPLALAAIGSLPLPLLDRSWTIHLVRTQQELPLQLHRKEDRDQLEFVRQKILDWSQGRQLDTDPPLPWKATSRRTDNARPLIAFADACSDEWGRIVRDALVRLSQRYRDEDLLVILLHDIRTVFDTRNIDRITSVDLVEALVAMEDQPWPEYRGPRDDQQPKKLTPASMAVLLAKLMPPIGPIRPRAIRISSKGSNNPTGYRREWFEKAWEAFCQEPHTRTRSNVIKGLLGA
jgi:hypothetical protein